MSFEHTSLSSLTEHYAPLLDIEETEQAIVTIKRSFERALARALNLRRVTAPLLVPAGTGINDDLNGVERPVHFAARGLDGRVVEVVQSLAKWKRLMLHEQGIQAGAGLYTDMNAIRPDETLDCLHSMYVDQWDWERTIRHEDRNLAFLESTVRDIYGAIRQTQSDLAAIHPHLGRWLPEALTFVHTEDLEAEFPALTPAQREHRVASTYGAVFVVGVGAALPGSGQPHDGRAPDYDDWITPNGHGVGLNGDLIVWYPPLGRSIELSSMGIRVVPESLEEQLRIRGCTDRRDLYFHRMLLGGALPPSIGGGIGQSRLCMYLLRKLHVGEVQAGVWPDEMRKECAARGVRLL